MLTKDELGDLYSSSCLTQDGLNLVCLSFNVNAAVEESFDDLLKQVLEANSDTLPDVFVVGLQELVPLNAQNIVGASLFSEGEEAIDKWLWVILTALSRIEAQYDSVNGTFNPYELLCHEHMVGLWVCVIVSRAIRPTIKNVHKAHCQRGVGGMFGNKGAVCVRFDVHDSSVCLVNAHFAANRGSLAARNLDFHAILHKEMFPDSFLLAAMDKKEARPADMAALQGSLKALRARMHDFDEDSSLSRERESIGNGRWERGSDLSPSAGGSGVSDHPSSPTPATCDDLAVHPTDARESTGGRPTPRPSISLQDDAAQGLASASPSLQSSVEAACEQRMLSPDDHDIIIFLGDLNYRISKHVPDAHVFSLIEAGRLAELAELDQLNMEKDSGSIFEGFIEGILTFPPTYKYLHNSPEYDRRPDKKARCPAWCDRVLWRTAASREQEVQVNTGLGLPSNRAASVGCGSAGFGLPMHSENVELMCYNAGTSGISDHKPVYASLNVKVKRVDWAASEQMLLDVMQEFCFYDADLREATTRSGGSALCIEPSTINLHSLPPVGDSVQLRLRNRLECAVSYSFFPPSVPPWLDLDCLHGVLPAAKAPGLAGADAEGSPTTLRASVDHIRASQAYGEEMGCLDLACGAGARALLDVASRPEVTALLVLQLRSVREGAREGGSLAEVLIPVVVYLGAPQL